MYLGLLESTLIQDLPTCNEPPTLDSGYLFLSMFVWLEKNGNKKTGKRVRATMFATSACKTTSLRRETLCFRLSRSDLRGVFHPISTHAKHDLRVHRSRDRKGKAEITTPSAGSWIVLNGELVDTFITEMEKRV